MRRSMAVWSAALCGAFGAIALAGSAAAAGFTQPGPGDWRAVDADNTLVIDTNQGRMIIELYPLVAPQSVERLKVLARQHFYDGLTFFRVIDDFMDQTGDPKNTGEGASTLPNVPAEFIFRRAASTPFAQVDKGPGLELGFIGVLPVASRPMALGQLTVDGKVEADGMFCPGVVGMARAQDPDSANSQFFIMRQDHAQLNGQYAAVGRVVVGEDVARRIKIGEPPAAPQDGMLKVQVLADMPANARPIVQVVDTRSAYFTGLAAQAKAAHGTDFSPCELEAPSQVK